MTKSFRQKLLNWFTSISYLLLFSALAPAFVWFVTIPRLMEISGAFDLWWFAGVLGETLVIYPIFFLPILFWHLCDFAQREAAPGKAVNFLSRYRTMAISTGIAIFAGFLIATAIFQVTDCPPLPEWMAVPYSCTLRPARWLQFLFYGPLLFSLFLCMAKLAITVSSIRKTSE